MTINEHPIIMSAESVRHILAGTKQETRRIVKHQYPYENTEPKEHSAHPGLWIAYTHDGKLRNGPESGEVRCPYGAAGSFLWVKETWAHADEKHPRSRICYRADMTAWGVADATDITTGELVPDQKCFPSVVYPGTVKRWKSSLYMPRWASRIRLLVCRVRMDRLHEMTEEDARAEGCASLAEYKAVWQTINGDRVQWEKNPWVWVVGFLRAPARVAE